MKDFRSLIVWEKSHSLTLEIYSITSKFPKEELYGLTSQMRRASASIPTNIAEGCGRASQAEFARFLHISMGSASELEYQILLANALGFIDTEKHTVLLENVFEVKKMLVSLSKKLKADG